jgi:hypothetical protein
MKLTIVGLTILSLLVAPMLYYGNDSSERAAWESSVTANFQGVTSDYDFRSFSPDWNDILVDTINLYNTVVTNVNTSIDYIVAFFENPVVAVLEILPDDPVYPGAPEELTFWRYNEILLSTVTNSRYSVMATLTEDELFWFAYAFPTDNPIMVWQITFERWWIGCFCIEESLQQIALDLQ